MPPRLEYALTPLGATLTEPLRAVRLWAESHIEEVLTARAAFDAHEPEPPPWIEPHSPAARARTGEPPLLGAAAPEHGRPMLLGAGSHCFGQRCRRQRRALAR